MGETASKPSPEPVHLIMKKIGKASAVLIGDTPDDIRAGLAAGSFARSISMPHRSDVSPGIKALGVVAPSVVDIKKDAENLGTVGAAYVMLPGCAELQLLL